MTSYIHRIDHIYLEIIKHIEVLIVQHVCNTMCLFLVLKTTKILKILKFHNKLKNWFAFLYAKLFSKIFLMSTPKFTICMLEFSYFFDLFLALKFISSLEIYLKLGQCLNLPHLLFFIFKLFIQYLIITLLANIFQI